MKMDHGKKCPFGVVVGLNRGIWKYWLILKVLNAVQSAWFLLVIKVDPW
jgi:hypothetical protein